MLFEQFHVPFNRSTMASLMNTCADRCVGLFALMKQELLSQDIAHANHKDQ
jgi:hypothetical protein